MKPALLCLLLSIAWLPMSATPQVPQRDERPKTESTALNAATAEKLKSITLPLVTFQEVAMDRCLQTLSFLSEEYDMAKTGPFGVKITMNIPPAQSAIITGRYENKTVEQILGEILSSAKLTYALVDGVVVVGAQK